MASDSSTASHQDAVPRIILRIPGPWESALQLQEGLAKASGEFKIFQDEAGPFLLHEPSNQRFTLTVTDRDDDIADLLADSGRASQEEVRALENHQVKVFISGPGGSIEAARMFLAIGATFIKAGALAVMVDNSGNCHSPRDWISLASDEQLGGLYWAFVSMTASEGEVFSAGMHCLGFRDAELLNPTKPKECGMMLHEFLGYSYQSDANLLDGDPLGGEDGPEFTLRHVECTRFPKDMPWHNPYGIWRLEKFAGEKQD